MPATQTSAGMSPARVLSLVGNIITLVALPVLVYLLSDSAFLTALGAGLEAAPYAVFGLVAGALSDRWNRKTVMVTAALGMVTALWDLGWVAATWLLLWSLPTRWSRSTRSHTASR